MVTIDSNVAVYALGTAGWKKQIATKLVGEADFISVQVLNEFANVARRKLARGVAVVSALKVDVIDRSIGLRARVNGPMPFSKPLTRKSTAFNEP